MACAAAKCQALVRLLLARRRRRCAQALAAARAAEEGGAAERGGAGAPPAGGDWATWWEALFLLKEAEAWRRWEEEGDRGLTDRCRQAQIS